MTFGNKQSYGDCPHARVFMRSKGESPGDKVCLLLKGDVWKVPVCLSLPFSDYGFLGGGVNARSKETISSFLCKGIVPEVYVFGTSFTFDIGYCGRFSISVYFSVGNRHQTLKYFRVIRFRGVWLGVVCSTINLFVYFCEHLMHIVRLCSSLFCKVPNHSRGYANRVQRF